VEEWFRNGGMLLDEASYLYPLPGEAVFSDFSLWQGDRELKGEPMDAAQARAIYEDIVRRKRDPALLELAGHGRLRARVFPLAASWGCRSWATSRPARTATSCCCSRPAGRRRR